MFIVGSMFLGKVKELNGQWIESKFVIIGIPLFPTSSMLVTNSSYNRRQGMSIPLHGTSIIAAYLRVFLALIAAGLLIGGSVEDNSLLLFTGVLLAAVWAYCFFMFGKTKPAEAELRNKMGNAIGIYASPEWFDFDMTMQTLKNAQYNWDIKYPNEDWKATLREHNVPSERYALLYTLALFNYRIDPSPDNEALYTKADRLFQ